MMNINELAENYTFEQLAAALYTKGLNTGYAKVTDKTKWREPVMAEKLGHIAHEKISAGAGKDEYGSDAYDSKTGRYAEYKSGAIEDKKLRNLNREIRNEKTGERYASLKVSGVYNGAYKQSALDAYKNIDHYFGVFYREQCVMIIKVNTDEVMRQLINNNNNRKPGKTTNLNTVTIDLDRKDLYNTVFQAKILQND